MSAARCTRVALIASLVVLVSTCLWAPGTEAAQASTNAGERLRATDKALRWLDLQQNTDGGFGEGGSDPQATCEVVLAFAAAYEEPATIQEAGNSPLDYLATQAVSYTSTAEGTARMILAVVAGNEDPRDFRGTYLVTTIKGYRDGSGQYTSDSSDGITAQALAILALVASKEPVPPNTVLWLLSQQNSDGGWGPMPTEASDTTSTALSLQALVSGGESPTSPAVGDAIDYLNARLTADSGFARSAAESESDPAATAGAIQALLAVGEDLFSSQWSRCLRTPFDALLDLQSGDGSFDGDVQATAESVPGLMGRTMPLPGRRLAALKGLEWLATQQQTDGGFGNGGVTADAVYAIALCDQDPDGLEWTKSGGSALDALASMAPAYIAGAPGEEPAGELAKVIRAVYRAGGDPKDFASMNLVDDLIATYDEPTGRYHPTKVFSHDLALMALHTLGETIPVTAATTLEEEQARLASGGWAWAWGGSTCDVDSTGLSMHALSAAGGPSSPTVFTNAAAFLQSMRLPDGGFPDLSSSSDTNCDATALAIQGLLAAGRHRDEPLVFFAGDGGAASSWDALLALQEGTGSFAFTSAWPESRLLATVEAIHALMSPLYPAYEPVSEGNATEAGTPYGRLTCGGGLEVVALYTGDDDNDGSATLRYRALGETEWSGITSMGKTGIAHLERLGLDAGTEYEIEITYTDPDGVSGDGMQTFVYYFGQVGVPLIMGRYGG